MNPLSIAILTTLSAYIAIQIFNALMWLAASFVMFVIEVRNDFIKGKGIDNFETFINKQ